MDRCLQVSFTATVRLNFEASWSPHDLLLQFGDTGDATTQRPLCGDRSFVFNPYILHTTLHLDALQLCPLRTI